MNRLIRASYLGWRKLALTPDLSPRRGGNCRLIFVMRRFVRRRQAIGHYIKSGVMAAALQDASAVGNSFDYEDEEEEDEQELDTSA